MDVIRVGSRGTTYYLYVHQSSKVRKNPDFVIGLIRRRSGLDPEPSPHGMMLSGGPHSPFAGQRLNLHFSLRIPALFTDRRDRVDPNRNHHRRHEPRSSRRSSSRESRNTAAIASDTLIRARITKPVSGWQVFVAIARST
jgi:hypothetical protein